MYPQTPLESAINVYMFLKHELRCESKLLSDYSRLSEDASSDEEAAKFRAQREVIYAKQALIEEKISKALINVRSLITPENKEEVRLKYGFT